MIKLITHNDLDGIGCYIVLRTLLDDDIDVEYCNYQEVNDVALDTLSNEEKYEKIYITDISVTEDVADRLDTISNKLVLLDHHVTALFLNKYKWANVKEYEDEEKTCGTKLLYNYIFDNYSNIKTNDTLNEFVWKTKLYDTWLWADKYDDVSAKYLNDLMYIIGKETFIEEMAYKIISNSALFNDFDLKLLEIKQREIDDYVEKKNKYLIKTNILGYNAGIVFAESNISELGNKLCNMNPELDLVIMINQKGISYRTAKDNVNVSEIAKQFGVGGHPKASGSSMPNDCLERFISDLFKQQ
ncbi:MAG: hypothetical protein IJH34_02205 [Romboutsia sp.]|nr:hypothetical protein [Romboutsia sp.]